MFQAHIRIIITLQNEYYFLGNRIIRLSSIQTYRTWSHSLTETVHSVKSHMRQFSYRLSLFYAAMSFQDELHFAQMYCGCSGQSRSVLLDFMDTDAILTSRRVS